MPLRRKGLLEAKEKKKNLVGRKDKKSTCSGRHKMAIGVVFTFSYIVGGTEVRKRK